MPRLPLIAAALAAFVPPAQAALIVCAVHGQYLAFFPGEDIGAARTLARETTGSCREVVSCPTGGWFAAATSRDPATGRWGNAHGIACGHGVRANAEAKAVSECAAQQGEGCTVWRSGHDTGSEPVFDAERTLFCAARDTECATL